MMAIDLSEGQADGTELNENKSYLIPRCCLSGEAFARQNITWSIKDGIRRRACVDAEGSTPTF